MTLPDKPTTSGVLLVGGHPPNQDNCLSADLGSEEKVERLRVRYAPGVRAWTSTQDITGEEYVKDVDLSTADGSVRSNRVTIAAR